MEIELESKQALVRSTSPEPDSDSKANGRIHPQRGGKWRKTVSVGIVLATIVLVTNVAVLGWARSSFQNEDGVATLFEGSCDKTVRITVLADLAINALSTLLLGASNNNAQILTAPTRIDVDRAHAHGVWLDVGVNSLRNLRFVPRWRRAIWIMLLISSVPLHLLYNSVVFSTRSAVDYQAAIVTLDFLHGGWWDTAVSTGLQTNAGLFKDIQKQASTLTRLDNKQCIQAYGTSMYETDWRNVLVVTSLTSSNSSLLGLYEHMAGGYNRDVGWVCHGDIDDYNSFIPKTTCNIDSLLANSESWTIPNVPACVADDETNTRTYNLLDGSDRCISYSVPVEYCLAEPFAPHCTVDVSTRILTAVIVCNIIKIGCMLSTVFAHAFVPLATIGDAMASFLERPDAVTANKGALEVGTVTSGVWLELDKYTPLQWTKCRRRWWYAVARPQLYLCFFLCVLAWILGVVALVKSLQSTGTSSPSISDFGNVETKNIITASSSKSLVANVVLANTPQLIISFIYIFYNDVFTRMLMSHEYSQFASVRKALRVTKPRGQQRSSYYLQLPYKYIVPMMLTMALLHWLVSRSIFLVRISIFDYNGLLVPTRGTDACGFSPVAILLALCLSAVMILVLVVLGRFRYLGSGMPAASSCSVAISAAAHPSREEPADLPQMPLQYGVVPGTRWRKAQYGAASDSRAGGWREHVGFSSKEVAPLQSGIVYW